MNKTELKNFAVKARRELLKQVRLRANLFGITEKIGLKMEEKFGQLMINGKPYPAYMKSAFRSLQNQLQQKGYEQVLEEVAYTWFNRIIAIRYMEIHDYLPERVHVLSSSINRIDPDILTEYETMELPIGKSKVKNLLASGDTEGAYRQLFIAQCNALNEILPFMFEEIQDYTELLLPDYLLDKESIINILVENDELTISFEDVEVIGWLYQFYISEKKDEVFNGLKKNIKITQETLPAATQLFTPKWIVRYMVENSLGRIWLESYPSSPMKSEWKYFLDEANQDEDVIRQLKELHYKNINPEELTFLDPCCGSGHILVYAFDVFYSMYQEKGYMEKEIPQLILEKNLFGLDVDDRAVQMASFAVMMKAREKSRKIFRSSVKLNICAIQESNWLTEDMISSIANNQVEIQKELSSIQQTFKDAKEYGSILKVDSVDYPLLKQSFQTYLEKQVDLLEILDKQLIEEKLPSLLNQSLILSSKYDVVCTNPPYMSISNGSLKLNNFVKKLYPSAKTDLSTVFMEQTLNLCRNQGIMSMINIPVWMSKSSFEKFRFSMLSQHTFLNMLHFGRGIFGSDFGTTAFVIRKSFIQNYKAVFRQLYEELGNVDSIQKKEQWFFENKGYYEAQQKKFLNIASYPIAYSVSEKKLDILEKSKSLSNYAAPRKGLTTGDNEKFARLWFEISSSRYSIFNSNAKWFPMTKGGDFRRWYGNNEYVVNWENDGYEIRNFKDTTGKLKSRPQNTQYYLRECISWNDTTAKGKIAFRYQTSDYIPNASGPCVYFEKEDFYYLFGLLNSSVSQSMLEILAPNMKFEVGQMALVPIIKRESSMVEELVKDSVNIAKSDWDFFEYSWDFVKHPLLIFSAENLQLSFEKWEQFTQSQFNRLKLNEEELNRIFIEIYNLEGELTPGVTDKNVTIRKADWSREARSFLSYFIGCILGRYSLDADGLAYAGGEWDSSKYSSFKPNKYGLVQFTDTEYFEHDIIARLREFLAVTFSDDTVNKNLQWLAEVLSMKNDENAEARLRRYFVEEFFADHCKIYQKRPIYWLVDSGKQKGLRTLVYMHRYQSDTLATIRFEHLQEIQAKYNHEIDAIDIRLVNPNLSATEKRNLDRQKSIFKKRLEELLEFDKKLAEYANAQIPINLDDGVVENYAKFEGVLGKIK